MSDAQQPDLDLEHAQFEGATPSSTTCARCNQALGTRYFAVNGRGVCDRCLAELKASQRGSSFFKALLLGSAAGIVGALIYYGIKTLTGYDLALITIVVGIFVGKAVRKGAGASQSIVYRLLAIVLTWIAMCSTYVPMLVAQMTEGREGAVVSVAAWFIAGLLSLGVPFFLITEMEVIGLIIFGIGLWEAWRLSAPEPFEISGPFEAAPAAVPEPVPARATE